MFDEIIVCIGHNSKKANRYFDIELMEQKINETFENVPQVSVLVYNRLTAHLATEYDAKFV